MNDEAQRELKKLEFDPDERVLITCATTWPGHLGEPARVEDVRVYPDARALYTAEGRLVDIASPHRGYRWWQVEAYCRATGTDHVPIYFDGPACDAPTELLAWPYVAVRRSSGGPWVLWRFKDESSKEGN